MATESSSFISAPEATYFHSMYLSPLLGQQGWQKHYKEELLRGFKRNRVVPVPQATEVPGVAQRKP